MSVTNVYDISNGAHASKYVQASLSTVSTLTALAGPIPSWATMAFITPETGVIRYRCDGTAATAAVGQPIAQNTAWPIQGLLSLAAASLVAQSGTVTVSIEFRG